MEFFGNLRVRTKLLINLAVIVAVGGVVVLWNLSNFRWAASACRPSRGSASSSPSCRTRS